MSDIYKNFEAWKNKLLDLTNRNKLLNYRDTLRSNLKITYPDIYTLFDLLVEQEGNIIFPYTEDERDEDKYYTSNVKTNKNVTDTKKTLRNLRNRAKISLEEQGVNVLYMSFGFLNWTQSDSSNRIFKSPLILVPVKLTVESINSPFELSLYDDDIVINPTLEFKLKNDYGISMPKFNSFDDIKLVFDEIRKCVNNNKWYITEEAGLSLLSFLKINMYLDLVNNTDKIVEHPIIRALGGDLSGLPELSDDVLDMCIDRDVVPMETFQVVDADSSQEEAIMMAKKGYSFVLQGPPGTGKSQTITNIISESMAAGKKILFVSEKKAALDVVYSKLESAGLGDFCLVLHSYNSNKRNVLDQLEKSIDLSDSKAEISEQAYRNLEALEIKRDQLNEYVNQLHKKIEPLGKTIYEANGIISNLESTDDVIFNIENIRQVSDQQYNKYNFLVSKLAKTMGRMTNDFNNNPWRGFDRSVVTHDFRQEVDVNLSTLILDIEACELKLKDIYSDLNLDIPLNMNNIFKLQNLLELRKSDFKIPYEWLDSDSYELLYEQIHNSNSLKNEIINKTDDLSKVYKEIYSDELIPFEVNTLEKAINEKIKILDLIENEDLYKKWSYIDAQQILELINSAEEEANKINALKLELYNNYEDEIIEIDYEPILYRFKTEYTSFTKIFKREYKEDKKVFLHLSKETGRKISDEEILFTLDKIKEIQKIKNSFFINNEFINKYFDNNIINENTDYSLINKKLEDYCLFNNAINIIEDIIKIHEINEQQEEALKFNYKFLYKGIFTDWETVRESLDWALKVKSIIKGLDISEAFISKFCNDEEFIDVCIKRNQELKDATSSIKNRYEWFISYFNKDEDFGELSLSDLKTRFKSCKDNLFLLEEWIDFDSIRKECIEEGLSSFIQAIEKEKISSNSVVDVFKKRFFYGWLDSVLVENPAVLNFRSKNHNAMIKEFSKLDRSQFKIAQDRVLIKLLNDLPAFYGINEGLDEVSILKREISKKRKILPIRRLFNLIPNLLFKMKPCFMMSPLSVSLFLDIEKFEFDIVIFDEASQVCTENAIGAIARGKQVVIAGDSHQLPPTNFFSASLSSEEFDETDEDEIVYFDAYDSILEESSMLPELTLRWHYRSRNESLIAFSNAKIYKNKLITFPSNIENSDDNGVEYIYVKEGWYDRGGQKGNVEEAKKIVELIYEHIKKHPDRSLGVVAFGEVQQRAIEAALLEKRMKSPDYEYFFAENKEEAFFIKNLENVQGDERDTIIFSIGYAKDMNGDFKMLFGPLSKSGGERRLNVAITRAKYNVKLVGSIMPHDIDVDRISSDGPKLLRSYIDFAINGQKVIENSITESDLVEHDSPFEESVYNFLDRKGYKVVTQVGCSGYRIDMAVKHPQISGVYVMGIECDGASYHSSRSARERDRLRQDVLESMGWKIYRIWSTDWIKDPKNEGEKLVAAIENEIEFYHFVNSDKDNNETNENEDKFLTLTKKETDKESLIKYYDFTEYNDDIFDRTFFENIDDYSDEDCIMMVVENCYPIHYDLLCQKIAPVYGYKSASLKIRRIVDYLCSNLKDKIFVKDDFVFLKDYADIPIRIPNNREIKYISIEELSSAMFKILKVRISLSKDDLFSEMLSTYGYKRMGPNIVEAFEKALTNLKSELMIVYEDGLYSIKNEKTL